MIKIQTLGSDLTSHAWSPHHLLPMFRHHVSSFHRIRISSSHADLVDRLMSLQMFPKLRQATFSAQPTTALFVPFVHRMDSPYTYKILLNTPDRNIGSEAAHKVVHAAFTRASINGHVGATRHNHNVFTVEFDGHQSRETVRISLPTSPSVGSDHVEVHGEHMLRSPPRGFACDVAHLCRPGHDSGARLQLVDRTALESHILASHTGDS